MIKTFHKVLRGALLLGVLLFQLGLGSSQIAHALTCLLNDTFECRTVVPSPYSLDAFDTTGAATAGELGEKGIEAVCNPYQREDNHSLYLGHKSVWYEFKATATRPVYMDTLGSDYDTYIAVWTGSMLNDLSLVACDDDSLAGLDSQLSLNAISGTTYYIQIAQYNGYYQNGARTVSTGGNLSFHLYDIPGAGKYDDLDPHWSYTGSAWTTYTDPGPTGPYDLTLHYTTTAGDWAWFPFEGTQFILTYTKYSNRGDIDVYVDGLKVDKIDAYSTTLDWQRTFTSPILPSGTHVVQFRHAGGGSIIDVDAIEILNTPVPGVGKYDDRDAGWFYAGTWREYNGSGPYDSTLTYTYNGGDAAWFTFSGTQFIISYTQLTNRASFDVYVDGNKVNTINAYGALQWQKTFTSPIFRSGEHIVQIRHAGGRGVVDVDAIEILNTPAPGAGKYDDTDVNWFYAGSWVAYSGSGPYNNTLHYTATVGDTASFTFDGIQFIFNYTMYTNRGSFDVYVDGSRVTTINANGALQWQKVYISPVYSAGIHVVDFKHVGGGTYIDVDAIQILDAPATGVGKYDDADVKWLYSGSWTTWNGSGPYNSTLHYTLTAGDVASFMFSGTQFILSYTQLMNRGNIDVYVDGNKLITIKAYGTLTWQKTFTSPLFPAGTHVVQIRHAGGGSAIDMDAIEILNTPVPGAGKYDDTDVNWFYAGSWVAYSGSGPYNSTLHYTSTAGSTAWFTFSGTQFILSYTQLTNRGNIDVYVDGNKVTTVRAYGALQWQKTFTSPVYPAGTHVVQFKHAGGGTIIDVDAIEILNTPAPGVGKYDDTDVNWFHTGLWITYSNAGPYNNSLHYTSTLGSSAWFTFSGTQFAFSYTQLTNRGKIDVYVDGIKVDTINAYGTLQWQKVYFSPTLPAGTHIVQFRHAGGGTYIDVDAIQVFG